MADARRPLVAANWKMHKTREESRRFWEAFSARLTPESTDRVEVVLCPPYPSLPVLAEAGLEERGVFLGAQNVHDAPRGAFTGEVSIPMLQDVGCRFVIVGHSERRIHFGESDDMIARKVRAVLEGGMTPILCVGESLEQREAGRAEAVVIGQLEAALAGLDAAGVSRTVVAYEPVWAIGTGRSADPGDAGRTGALLRRYVAERYGEEAAARVRILYGGSVNPDNFGAFLAEPEVDGALVGTASLDPETFAALVEEAARREIRAGRGGGDIR